MHNTNDTDNTETVTATRAFQLKGGLFTLTTLQLLSSDLNALAQQLALTLQQAPKFLHHAPLVIDLQRLSAIDAPLDFVALLALLRTHKLIPVGLRHATQEQQQAALTAGLALLADNLKPVSAAAPLIEKAPPVPAAASKQASKVVTQAVRSGQQIYAQGADLIVIGTVSPGAELLSDGNIHIYGTLHGRALAGISGDINARIFCQSLNAELIAIAGHYWVNEDLKSGITGRATQIYLEADKLRIAEI